ncbi:STAS domain-containing protein [Streptosporangium saharense]|uniref:STAS domain-containing protein n=1 Tax=Streptosporangium saharense TaxID=1706840 RepID=UPI00368B9929
MAVVHVHGPLDYATSARLETEIDQLWERVSGGYLVLDLQQVTFCDSTGLSRLITAFADARQRQTTLLLAALPLFLHRTLELTGLTPFLPVRESLAQALSEAKAHCAHTDGQQPFS